MQELWRLRTNLYQPFWFTSGGFEGEISLNTMKNHSLFFVTSIPEYRKRHNLEFGLDLDHYFWNILDFCLDYRTRYFPWNLNLSKIMLNPVWTILCDFTSFYAWWRHLSNITNPNSFGILKVSKLQLFHTFLCLDPQKDPLFDRFTPGNWTFAKFLGNLEIWSSFWTPSWNVSPLKSAKNHRFSGTLKNRSQRGTPFDFVQNLTHSRLDDTNWKFLDLPLMRALSFQTISEQK